MFPFLNRVCPKLVTAGVLSWPTFRMTSSATGLDILDRAVKLSYTSYQSTNQLATGDPIILIHGMFGSKRNWESLAKAFNKATNRKVISVDCRNHGESPKVPEMDYSLMAADIELLLQDMNIPEAAIVGHSMGGKVAMTLALTKPQLVSKLVVEDVSPAASRSVVSSTFPQYIDAMKKVIFDHSQSVPNMRKLADQQLEESFPDRLVRSFILTNIVRSEENYHWKVNLDALSSNMDQLFGFPQFENSYFGDVLFIGGQKSEAIREKDVPNIKRLFPEAQIQHIDGAGHWIHSEKPKEFMKIVLEFLQYPS